MLRSIRNFSVLTRQPQKFAFFSTAKAAKPKDYSKLTYYEILNISPTATQKQLKAKYYELAKIYHPDTYKGNDSEYFKYIQRAYETLKNPEKRKEYDMKNNIGFQSDAPGEGSDPRSSTGEEGRKKGHFEGIEIDENMNFDEEYEKFMGKPIENHPETIVVQEHPFLQQLNREERMRYEYAFLRNNVDVHVLKYMHTKGYDESLNETIQLTNKRAEMSDEVKQRLKEKDERDASLKMTIMKLTFFAILVPAIMIAFHKRMQVKQKLIYEAARAAKEEEELQIKLVQESFVFDDEK